ncbi:hypothetical protein [Paenibacillus azoreducens]|uniref:Uncharacterized protein n=1 Tax=Paenibacillus azoreducens TaxID=116718 RepID=A0A919Y7N4_9BACL|nr:hypothetical protein [Paenibacillus azoreducens]GIO45631.1 hypothetical protein J34TS1_03960 [Paenibacillus azoreducens]
MNNELNAVNQWLENQVGQTILIRKEEQGDLDETRVQLEAVEYSEHVPARDEYAEGSSLILHGPGHVINEKGDIPLPRNTFQIYVDGLHETETDESRINLTTDRAKYLIFKLP